ncbi:PREDICTED: uncharacterized protein LOC104818426 isoform X2 [Tarenaya hassleriana]|uniref:uncharacterized protein LOC104818426 isoform X2 n=1 Tax=Tarenaya hassleriana TaxID=28532 RepID=UPI00053C11D3|nr:PREDICTED: uncharacterized protein LOC104818426 isoform X2 [Tarenaya hassleriana]
MSAVSGVISRQLLPACGDLCIFCPALRARSRQPVKRYKKLIAEIFPRNQAEGPNDRKIGKLCEYAAKNPLRMPKISNSLEQRFYKELRNENFQSAKIVMCIYRKLLVTCKEQMTLFASGLLRAIQALLDQSQQDDMQITGCQTLFEFVNNQKDSSYINNLEGFIPKLCQLAREVGDNDRSRNLRAAGLQALSSMVWLMGEYSHISNDFDNVVCGVLENYGHPKIPSDANESNRKWVNEVLKNEGHTAYPDSLINVPSWRNVVNDNGESNVTMEDSRDPSFWSKVCLQNMAKLGEEATTVRRILESLFRYFDEGNLWSKENSTAFQVLRDLQFLMEKSGQGTHFLLSMLIKHLDHKNVLKQPSIQLDILWVTTSLAEQAKIEHSVAIVGAICDIMRHLRKNMHCSLDDANSGADETKLNRMISVAVDKCLIELAGKVGDAGPILDAMAMMLENISAITDVARTMIATVFRAAQIIASMPYLSYRDKAFHEALFHQLLQSMVHPDHETRIGAHRIFSVVLVPTSVCPRPSLVYVDLKKGMGLPRSLSRTVSVFSSSAALFEKLKKDKFSSILNPDQIIKESVISEEEPRSNSGNRLKSSYSQAYSTRDQPEATTADTNSINVSNSDLDVGCLRLSSHQISVLLSSIWAQSISPANTPENYEAIANTYSLLLLFSRAKNSSHEALIRSLQMALSLRDISLMEGGPFPPSRRRSLFMLATCMILFSSKAFNLLPLVDFTKAALQAQRVDPFLRLFEDHKLEAVKPDQRPTTAYGSKEDDATAIDALSSLSISKEQSREILVTEIVKSLDNVCNSEMDKMREKLLCEFLPDDACPLGTRFLGETQSIHQVDPSDAKSQKEDTMPFSLEDQELGDGIGTLAKNNPVKHTEISQLLSVNQLMESVVDTTHQVGRISVHTASDFSYKEMTFHCEALLMGKQQKFSSLLSTQLRQESLKNVSPRNHNEEIEHTTLHSQISSCFHAAVGIPSPASSRSRVGTVQPESSSELESNPQSFRLPASSPYENFLKAAGC